MGLHPLEGGAGLAHIVAVQPPAEGIEQHRRLPHQGADLVEPLLHIRRHHLHGAAVQADVAPGVAAEGPACALEGLHDGLDRFDLLLAAGFPLWRPVLPVRLGAVAQDTLIAGEAQAALGAEGGEVGMLLDELVQDGDGIQDPG